LAAQQKREYVEVSRGGAIKDKKVQDNGTKKRAPPQERKTILGGKMRGQKKRKKKKKKSDQNPTGGAGKKRGVGEQGKSMYNQNPGPVR